MAVFTREGLAGPARSKYSKCLDQFCGSMNRKDEDGSDESQLLKTLYNYIQSTNGQKIEVKPDEFADIASVKEISSTSIEKIRKDTNSIMVRENQIICDNILMKFFELNDEKFLACIRRINDWGFETCFREFILNYYLYIKKSNRLRQYILLHLDSIVSSLKDIMEIELIEGMKDFNFENYKTREEVEFLKNDLKNREVALMAIKAKNFNEFAPPNEEKRELLSSSQRKDLRMEVLNRLRYENPRLEEDF